MESLIRFSVVLAIALSVIPTASAFAAVAYPQPPQLYYHSLLRNFGSGLYVQPEYEAAINGLGIVQQPCNETDLYQRWWFYTLRLDYGRYLSDHQLGD